jgi:polysaccharide biosynthesis transport protein
VVEEEMELEAISNKLKVYERKIDQYKRAHPDELSQTLELARLERSRKVYEDTYNILLEKVEVAKIKRAAETGGLSIIDPVFYPDKAVPKNETAYYVVGLLVSLILGLAFIFLREVLDTTVKSNDDLEHAYNVPIIGTIPHIDIAKKNELQIKRRSSANSNKEVVTTYPKELIDFYKDESIIAESYRSLRTNLFFTSPDNPLRSLIVTSSGPHEGKSLTASNLALACAQMGKKVLLIDTDLRRPVLHHLFQHTRENGITDLFIGKEIHEVTKPTGIDNLTLITAGRFTPNPSEHLASKKIEKLIEQLKNDYDLIIFDTPPVMAVTDAPLLSTKVDGVVLVVKAYKTDKNVLEHSVAALQNINAHVAGFILNDINLSHRYASYGYYKYYYHYYRSQKD